MNKFQEALDSLFDNISVTQQNMDALDLWGDVLQELIDKETPMRLSGDSYNKKCNICGNGNLNTKYTYGNYCSGCGQKIDWSDEE